MSEPIILTERERAVFAELVSHLMGEANNRDTERAWQLGEVLRAWLRDMEPPTESASPPRVPEQFDAAERLSVFAEQSNSTLEKEAMLAGAAEIRRLREQVDAERDYKAGLARLKEIRAEGFRAGIEAAATHLAATTATRHLADEVRALADKPAPTEFRVEPKDGLTWLNFYRAGEFVAGIELRQWLRPQVADQMVPYFDEIAVCKGG